MRPRVAAAGLPQVHARLRHHIRQFTDLSTDEILSRVRDQHEEAHWTCIRRFRQHGITLKTETARETAIRGGLSTAGNVADLMVTLNE